MTKLLTIVLFILVGAYTAFAAPAEVRGTFYELRDVAGKSVDEKVPAAVRMAMFADIGINTVYITFEDSVRFNQAVIEAHRHGLLAIAFVPFPFEVEADSQIASAHPDWETFNSDEATRFPRAPFLVNPFHSEAQKWIVSNLTKIAIENDVDGIMIGFTFRGFSAGFDPYTRDQFAKETGAVVDHQTDRSVEFYDWRKEKLSEFSLQIVTELRAVNPDLILSTWVAQPPKERNPIIDWKKWIGWCECGGKHWDEFVVYGMFSDTSPAELANELSGGKIFITMHQRGWKPLKVVPEIRQNNFLGHCFSNIEYGKRDFESLYDISKNGPARHPLKPANWRSTSIPATREGDVWVADLKEGNRYHVIVKKNGTWNDIGSFDLKPGRNTFLQDGDALELMVDRRP